MILEKCELLGMRPKHVMNLPDAENKFLTFALHKRSENGKSGD